MSPWKLQSSLAVEIQNFINLRRLSGTDYQSQVSRPWRDWDTSTVFCSSSSGASSA
jgi:hypothetical protein